MRSGRTPSSRTRPWPRRSACCARPSPMTPSRLPTFRPCTGAGIGSWHRCLRARRRLTPGLPLSGRTRRRWCHRRLAVSWCRGARRLSVRSSPPGRSGSSHTSMAPCDHPLPGSRSRLRLARPSMTQLPHLRSRPTADRLPGQRAARPAVASTCDRSIGWKPRQSQAPRTVERRSSLQMAGGSDSLLMDG